ncbi:winged helix-turn-helix transcriptional regulator [Streptomyces cyaneus]|uniref:winged helix-turn-helix transcriptional regulator n=1 Tax=Streptomyces cyaneus TaxID=1904 RepID=UPI003CCC5E8E
MIAVLNALILGPLGHNELARETNMDSKQLSRTLVRARDTGIVDRIVSGEIPPVRVHYELTPRGEDLARAIIPLALWSKNS